MKTQNTNIQEGMSWRYMPYGMNRRAAIISFLKENLLHVNRRWCLNLRYDLDLVYLLKKKIITRGRTSCFGSTRARHTVLFLAV